MRKAMAEVEWGEVVRNGHKIEDWSWGVTFLVNGVVVDRHYYKTEVLAIIATILFERGDFYESAHGGVEFDKNG